jgi:hypothetical protein
MKRAWIPFAVVLALGVGCQNDSPNTVAGKLQACGLMSDGEVGPLPFYAPTPCYTRCLTGAGCQELQQALCDTSIELERRCDERCAFECDSGELVRVEQRCDTREDCMDGSDERDCEYVVCGDGTELPPDARCNGHEQCADGSDEQDCPSEPMCDVDAGMEPDRCEQGFTCEDSGRQLDSNVRCDGVRSCPDGSDEQGCAEITASCEMP